MKRWRAVGVLAGFATMQAGAWALGGCGVPLPELPAVPAQVRQVTEFGAWPDDAVPDDAAIEQALAALRPGDWLVFPPGRYLQARSLYVRTPDVTLYGAGAELQATSTTDQTLGVRASGVRVLGFQLSAAADQRQNTVESARLSVKPADDQAPALTGVLVRGNVITSGASAGIYVSRTNGFTIAENQVSGTLADGIHVTGGATRGRVAYNRVQSTGDDGVAVVSYLGDAAPVSEVLVEQNRVDHMPWGRGISVVGGDGVTVRGNRVRDVTRAAGILVAREDGWRTRASQRVLVEDNGLYEVQPAGPVTGHAGIELHSLGTEVLPGVNDVVLRGNVIAQGSTDGIRIGADTPGGGVQDVRIIGNRITVPGGRLVSVLVSEATSAPVADRVEGAQLDCLTLPR